MERPIFPALYGRNGKSHDTGHAHHNTTLGNTELPCHRGSYGVLKFTYMSMLHHKFGYPSPGTIVL